jgi:hypothetical protein
MTQSLHKKRRGRPQLPKIVARQWKVEFIEREFMIAALYEFDRAKRSMIRGKKGLAIDKLQNELDSFDIGDYLIGFKQFQQLLGQFSQSDKIKLNFLTGLFVGVGIVAQEILEEIFVHRFYDDFYDAFVGKSIATHLRQSETKRGSRIPLNIIRRLVKQKFSIQELREFAGKAADIGDRPTISDIAKEFGCSEQEVKDRIWELKRRGKGGDIGMDNGMEFYMLPKGY